jgi:hypothetical protein
MDKILEQIEAEYTVFKIEAVRAIAGNKAAGARARKASLKLRDLLKNWKAASII